MTTYRITAGRLRTFGLVLSLLTAAVLLPGCQSDAQTGALVGAGLGAGVGAIVGHQSRHAGEGAAIGAAAGALGGYIIGNESDKQRLERRQHPYYSY